MQKQKNFQIAVIGVLAFAVRFMSVGFAAYSQNLQIDGTATFGSNKWSIHFDESSLEVATDSVTDATLSVIDDSTTVDFDVKLEKPGDSYAFTLDVINDGTFDAILDSISMTTLTEAQSKYLDFYVEYDGVKYTGSTTNISQALSHVTGANTHNVLVSVTYVQPTDSADLPAADTEVSLMVTLNYSQAQ